jgi:hypothetical protein
MTGLPAHALGRRWVHSHEEDTEDEMVFRPAEREFPPSRGRMRFELLPDGTFVESAPGPADAPEQRAGTWEMKGGKLVLDSEDAPEGQRVLEITSAENDRLVVKK